MAGQVAGFAGARATCRSVRSVPLGHQLASGRGGQTLAFPIRPTAGHPALVCTNSPRGLLSRGFTSRDAPKLVIPTAGNYRKDFSVLEPGLRYTGQFSNLTGWWTSGHGLRNIRAPAERAI